MLSYIEALEALSQSGTMVEAATLLRISQSAISKRIASLEARVGKKLIEKTGRRVQLTPHALHLLTQLKPVLSEFRSILGAKIKSDSGVISLGVSESILNSWGAELLHKICKGWPELKLEVHTHRSPVVVDRVAAGEYQLGLIAGNADNSSSLRAIELLREPMVLIPKNLGRIPSKWNGVGIITIESRSGTWGAIERRCNDMGLIVERQLESFFAVVQMSRAGFGHGLVPLGACTALGINKKSVHIFSTAKLSRPVCLVARPSVLAQSTPARFVEILQSQISKSI